MNGETDIWRGRSIAYRLLADFWRDGLSDANRDAIAEIVGDDASVPGTVDHDEWASAHYALLGMNVIPYAGWYLDEEGWLGGPSRDVASRFLYQFAAPGTLAEPADHISSELALLARVTEQAARGNDTNDVQRRFLDEHFLWWMLPFCFAVCRSGAEIHALVAASMLEIIADHRSHLGDGDVGAAPIERVLEHRGHGEWGARDVADFLATTARSGVVLTRRRIELIARQLELPRGFGSRRQMLSNLIRSSITYDRLPELVERIHCESHATRDQYDQLHLYNIAAIDVIADAWKHRIGASCSIVDGLLAYRPSDRAAHSL